MAASKDERSQCSVKGCKGGVWFTAEQLCRRHGVKRGVETATSKAVTAPTTEGESDA